MKSMGIGSVASAVLLAGGLNSASHAHQEGEESAFTANIGVTSNYVWRGASQTGNAPAVQGGVDYAHRSGFYIGSWLSNVNFGDSTETTLRLKEDGTPDLDENDLPQYDTETSSGSEYELDGYLGWGGELAENIALDVGYVYYHYGLNGSGGDFGELYGNLGLWWFDIGVYYTPNSQVDDDTSGFDEGDIAYYLGFNIDLAESWSLGLTVGQYDFTNDGNRDADGEKVDLSYGWGQIDLTKSAGRFGDFTLSVSQAGEEADGNDNPKVFVTWTKGWQQKRNAS